MQRPAASILNRFEPPFEDLLTSAIEGHASSGYRFVEFENGVSLRMDTEGRWCSMQTGRRLLRRTLDGIWTRRKGDRYIDLSARHQDELYRNLRITAQKLAERLEDQSVTINGDIEASRLKQWFTEAARRNREDYAEESRFFNETYPEHIPIVPPDRYRDVVVQPATGCPHADCTFCAFYKDTRFTVLSPDAFQQHLQRISKFFGKALEARNGIFLGSASALSLGQRRMLAILERLEQWMPHPKRGIAAFLDPDHAPDRRVQDYRELAELGLSHVTIGLETGSAALRNQMGKAGNLKAVTKAIEILKKADIQVALTVLVGPGGAGAAVKHREETARAVAELPLDKKDLIYLSPLEDSMPASRLELETDRLQNHLRSVSIARISPYRMHLFRYFT